MASYEPAVKLSLSHPRASPGCHEFSCLVTLVRKMANKGASAPPSCSSFDSFFSCFSLRVCLAKPFQLQINSVLSFYFFCSYLQTRVQPVTRKLLRPRGMQVRRACFFSFCKFLHAHSQCLCCRVKKPKAAICGVIVPSDLKAALASESDGVLSVR